MSMIRVNGLTATLSVLGAMDGKVFKSYVREILTPQLHAEDVVLMGALFQHKESG
jgi:hypothetical protein